MSYLVEISSIAEAEVDGVFLRLSQVIPPDKGALVASRIAENHCIFIRDAKTLSSSKGKQIL